MTPAPPDHPSLTPAERSGLVRYAATICGEADAEDCVQDAEVRCSTRYNPQHHTRASYGTFCKPAVKHNAMKVRRRALGEEFLDSYALDLRLASGSRTDDAVVTKQSLALLQAAIDMLSKKQREVFILCVIEEFSIAEAAELLKIKRNNVNQLLYQARQELKQKLAAPRLREALGSRSR
jgi:RNA polymerase sigma factor (sigma-70 family)